MRGSGRPADTDPSATFALRPRSNCFVRERVRVPDSAARPVTSESSRHAPPVPSVQRPRQPRSRNGLQLRGCPAVPRAGERQPAAKLRGPPPRLGRERAFHPSIAVSDKLWPAHSSVVGPPAKAHRQRRSRRNGACVRSNVRARAGGGALAGWRGAAGPPRRAKTDAWQQAAGLSNRSFRSPARGGHAHQRLTPGRDRGDSAARARKRIGIRAECARRSRGGRGSWPKPPPAVHAGRHGGQRGITVAKYAAGALRPCAVGARQCLSPAPLRAAALCCKGRARLRSLSTRGRSPAAAPTDPWIGLLNNAPRVTGCAPNRGGNKGSMPSHTRAGREESRRKWAARQAGKRAAVVGGRRFPTVPSAAARAESGYFPLPPCCRRVAGLSGSRSARCPPALRWVKLCSQSFFAAFHAHPICSIADGTQAVPVPP